MNEQIPNCIQYFTDTIVDIHIKHAPKEPSQNNPVVYSSKINEPLLRNICTHLISSDFRS